MEAKLFRLTIALSLLAFIGFGIPAISAIIESSKWHDLVLEASENQRKFRDKCAASVSHDYRYTDPSCTEESFKNSESSVNRFVKGRNAASNDAAFFTPAALGIPACLFLLFFGGRWIITGKLKTQRIPE